MATETMRAAVYEGEKSLVVRDLDVPPVGPGDVLVDVEYCGVCGTDLHFVIEGWGTPGSVGGHEWSGRVVGVGAEVTSVDLGDLVVGGPTSCSECRWCAAGRPSLCSNRELLADGPGAFAELHVAPASSLNKVPAGLTPRHAALTEPLAVSMHAVTLSRARPGMRVLVTGGGPVGLLAVAALRAQGVDDVTVSEPSPQRQSRAADAGAVRVLHPDELPEPPSMPRDVTDDPYDVVLECSGRHNAFERGLGLLAPMGTLVAVGTGLQRPRFDTLRVLLNELVVTGAYEYDADGFPAALALLASGTLPMEALVESDDVDLDGLLDAMLASARGEIARKVLVRP